MARMRGWVWPRELLEVDLNVEAARALRLPPRLESVGKIASRIDARL